jgi:hypothetical protein
MQSCPMRQVAAVPAADDGATRCSDRRRPPAHLDHSASAYPISRQRPTAACLAVGEATPLAGLALSPHGVHCPPSEERTSPPRGPAPRIMRCRLRPLYPKPRTAAMANGCRDQAPGGLFGRVPTPDKSGRPECTQQGLHSGSRSPLAGWV